MRLCAEARGGANRFFHGKIREVRMQPVSPLTDFSFDFEDLRLSPAKTTTSGTP